SGPQQLRHGAQFEDPGRLQKGPFGRRARPLDRGDLNVAAIDEAPDIQAIVDRGFGSLAGATHLLLRVVDPSSGRSWLRSLPVTSLEEAKGSKLDRVCQIAFTAPGLAALGFNPEEAGGFAPEFLDGMAGNERKSAQLGDIGANSPSNWEWGVGPSEP